MDSTIDNTSAAHPLRRAPGGSPVPDRFTAMLSANRRYADEYGGAPAPDARPTRAVAVVTCMDARLDPSAMLGLSRGESHILRNAGGVVTDDVIRSLAISQYYLGTEAIAVIHHTGCGALGLTDEAFGDRVERSRGTRPPWSAHGFADTAEDVRDSVRRVRTSPFLLHRDEVRGFVVDVETGLLDEIDCGEAG